MSWFGSLFTRKDREERRKAIRHSGSGAKIRVGKKIYPIKDISSDGLSIENYHGDLIAKQHFEFEFILPMQGETLEFPGHGVVVRIENGLFAAKYQPPQPYFAQKLELFLTADMLEEIP